MRFFFPFLIFFADTFGATVLITGANRGLGLEFAKQYKGLGYEVIGTARHPEKANLLKGLGVQIEELDVADPKSISALAKRLKGVPIDILINNAGVFRERNDSFEELDIDEMNYTFAVNSTGPVFLTQALLPNLREGKQKKIVNITSSLGSIARNSGGMYHYRASKAALNMLSRTMSIELGKEGFIVIALHPGWVRTDMGGASATYSPQQSIDAMIDVIDRLNKRSNGLYLDLNGKQIPW